jgi:hypothetical protein
MIDRTDIIIGLENLTCKEHIKGFREYLESLSNRVLADEFYARTGTYIWPIFHNKFMVYE